MSSHAFKRAEMKQQQNELRSYDDLPPKDRIVMCPDCDGTGAISTMGENGVSITKKCERCNGYGEVVL